MFSEVEEVLGRIWQLEEKQLESCKEQTLPARELSASWEWMGGSFTCETVAVLLLGHWGTVWATLDQYGTLPRSWGRRKGSQTAMITLASFGP